jgi:hypothetical protein
MSVSLLKSIFKMKDVNKEGFYINILKEARLKKNFKVFFSLYKNPAIKNKLKIIDKCLKQAIASKDMDFFFKILVVIPVDADILYYFKACLIAKINFYDTFTTLQYITFAVFIMTHVKSLRDESVLNNSIDILGEDTAIYKRVFSCHGTVKNLCMCKVLKKVLSYKILSIQNDNCLSYKYPLSLKGLSCVFKNSYIPIPKTEEEYKIFNTMINEPDTKKIGVPSINGAIFTSRMGEGYTNVEVAIKIPLENNNDILKEAVVSLCVINEYINVYPKLRKYYNYCFGIFSCPYFGIKLNDITTDIKNNLCKLRGDYKHDNIYSIYEKIQGKTLKELFETEEFDVTKIKIILKKLLEQLIILQEGPYKFTHYDLHPGNVMIDDKYNVHAIDYGLSSFRIAGINYSNFLEEWMTNKCSNDQTCMITTGVYDIYFFLRNIYDYTTKDSSKYKILQDYTIDIAKILLSGFIDKNNNPIDPLEMIKKINWLFYGDSPIARGNDKNIKLCRERTYRWIYNNLQSSKKLKFDNTGPYKLSYTLPTTNQGDVKENIVIEENICYSTQIYLKYLSYQVEDMTASDKKKAKLAAEYISTIIFDDSSITKAFLNRPSDHTFNEILITSKKIIDTLGLEILPMTF